MNYLIIKLINRDTNEAFYLLWSTIIDAPVTYGLHLTQFRQFYNKKYGDVSMENLEDRLKRVEQFGASSHDACLENLIEYNRAGIDETSLSYEEILNRYCYDQVALTD